MRKKSKQKRFLKSKPVKPPALAQKFTTALQLHQGGKLDAAGHIYKEILQKDPRNFDALYLLGTLYLQQGAYEEAGQLLQDALCIKVHPFALSNYGSVQAKLKRPEEALVCYERALALKPDYTDALNNQGNVLKGLKRLDEALTSYDRALQIKPDYAEALYNRGNLLKEFRRFTEAIENYQQVLAQDTENANAFCHMADCLRRICDWSTYAEMSQEMHDRTQDGRMIVEPFIFLSWSDEPADQLRCAKTYIKDKLGSEIVPFSPKPSRSSGTLRIAYLSADFYQHATAYLMAELFELHDRKRVEVLGVSYGPDDGSPVRQRLERSFDEFIDVKTLDDKSVAELLVKKNLHIAVDLKGYTTDSRPEILARRPAPIQVNYLGYPGTMGAEFIDYILVDPFVVPPEQQPFYTEKLVHLPACYQVNDRQRQIAKATPDRADCGLPAEGFVYCCFNNSYKITPFIFTIWMRLLTAIPGSVLWLLKDTEQVEVNLRSEATARGVEPDRLVFAPPRPLAEHLARHRLADLFLDTLPVNAHTTASDALWAGLPVLTCPGKSFAARVAGSLLHAVGLPELVTNNIEDYESLALALARDPQRLRSIKENLLRNRDTMPLFDSERFCRHLESAYETMWQWWRSGESPKPFSITPVTGTNSVHKQHLTTALQLHQDGKLEAAGLIYKEILQKDPRNFDALYLLGTLYFQHGAYEEASRLLQEALRIQEHPFALSNYGSVQLKLQHPEEALASFDRALAIKPDYAEAFNNRGNVLGELKRFEEALTSYDRALALKPDYAEALNNRGKVLQTHRHYEEALASYDRALALKPDYAGTLNNRGNVLLALKRHEEALASYDRALALKPDYAGALNNRGTVLKELKRFKEALTSYDRALALEPDYAEAHCNKGLLYLLSEDFKSGWREYEWRRNMENVIFPRENFSQPQWTGSEDLSGKTILLIAEQGLGDTLQFCRYAGMVKARGARVLLEVQSSLKSLLVGLTGIDGILSYGEALPDFDYHYPLLNLPLVFNTELETIPARHSYINAPVDKVVYWKSRLKKLTPPRIGLVWSGNPNHKNDHNRSIPLKLIINQLGDRHTFITLQTEVRPDDREALESAGHIHFYGQELKDFSDTAAIIENLDLVISVDTSTVHLAGALGKPVWVLLPFVPDWRWLLDRDDSPWYPTARLFRQTDRRDWDTVLAQVRSELEKLYPV